MRYAIVIEKAENNYCAYCPDVPGCVACGDSVVETQQEMQGALQAHLELMKEEGLQIPPATSLLAFVEVKV